MLLLLLLLLLLELKRRWSCRRRLKYRHRIVGCLHHCHVTDELWQVR